MKTKILKVKGDWTEVLNDCRSTVGKEAKEAIPSADFKRRILIAEHSPIRDISIKWIWGEIKSWIATHFSRHIWYKAITTQRDDRTGINRDESPQGAIVSFIGEANVQHLIDTARKRLCYQSHPQTRVYMEDLKVSIHKIEPQIADVMVPSCIYRGCACPEMKSCGYIEAFIKKYGIITPIQDRYDAYNKDFYMKSVDDDWGEPPTI
jgi:hypothetical protein